MIHETPAIAHADRSIAPSAEAAPDISPGRLRQTAAFCGRLAGRAGLFGVRVGLVAGCGIAALGAFGETEADIGPATAAAHMTIDLDGDAIAETNFGQIRFDVSDGPLGMSGRITSIDANAPEVVREQLDGQMVTASSVDPGDVLAPYEDSLEELIDDARRRGAALMLGGGIFGGLVAEMGIGFGRSVRRKELPNLRKIGIMGTSALLLPNVMLTGAGAWTAATMHEDALEHPTFGNDSLNELVSFAQNSFDVLDVYTRHSDRLTTWLENLIVIQQHADTLPRPASGLIPVLAIADTHSRPCSYDRAQALIDAFGARFVINAGDESEWGQPFEQNIFTCDDAGNAPHIENMGELQLPDRSGTIPIVLTPGNHDPNGIIETFSQYGNVVIPHSETVALTIPHGEGSVTFRIAGGIDPLNTPLFWERPSPEAERALVGRLGEEVAEAAQAGDADIAVVHQPGAGNIIDERLGPDSDTLIIQGHTHHFSLDTERGVVTLGSFGGSGLRTLQREADEEGAAIQATIMYFDPSSRQLVWGWDLRVQNDGSSTAEPFYFEQSPADEQAESTQQTTPNG